MHRYPRRRIEPNDPLTRSAITIDLGHGEIHEGHSFMASAVDTSMNDNDTLVLAFKTPTVTTVHLVPEFSTQNGGKIDLWEGADWTQQTGGTVPIINRRRAGSPPSSGLLENYTQASFVANDKVVANPTGLSTGSATDLRTLYAWGALGPGGGGYSRDLDEIVLKPDTQYALVFTAIGASNKGWLGMVWYEHDATDSE